MKRTTMRQRSIKAGDYTTNYSSDMPEPSS